MDSSSYLAPSEVKQQCNDMVKEYRNENTNIAKVRKNLQDFINDKKLKSDAFDALKSQVGDYMLLLSGMREANNADILDCKALKNAVGNEVLDGAYLIDSRDASKRRYDGYCAQESSYNAAASACDDPDMSSYYSGMASYYRSLAYTEYQRYTYFVGKIARFDAIEVATSSLFSKSKPIRTAVDIGLGDVSNNYYNGAYVASSNAKKWKDTLKKNGAKQKVYPPSTFDKFLNSASSILGGGETLYDTHGPIYLAMHGIGLSSKNGRYYFKTGGKYKKEVQNLLKNLTGKEWKGKALERAWKGEGLDVAYKMGKSHLDVKTLKDNPLTGELGEYIDDIRKGSNRAGAAKNILKRNFWKELNPKAAFKEFKEASKIGKAAKSIGFIGDALTVGSELADNFCEDGDIVVTPDRVQNFITDTAVDFGSSAATTAAGAAVGSLILPPLGTIVGAGIGMGLDYAANNWKISDFDGDGKKDSAVDGLKHLVDSGCNALGGLIFG